MRFGGGLMPKCIGLGSCTGASTKDWRSISASCTGVAGGTGGGNFGVVPGIGPMVASGALNSVMAFAVGWICNRSVTSAVWFPGCVGAAADAAGGEEVVAVAGASGGADELAIFP